MFIEKKYFVLKFGLVMTRDKSEVRLDIRNQKIKVRMSTEKSIKRFYFLFFRVLNNFMRPSE